MAGFGTGRSGDYGGVVVAVGRDDFGVAIAAGAGEGLDTVLNTGGLGGNHALAKAMPQRIHFIRNVAVATNDTGVQRVATDGARGLNDDCLILMLHTRFHIAVKAASVTVAYSVNGCITDYWICLGWIAVVNILTEGVA